MNASPSIAVHKPLALDGNAARLPSFRAQFLPAGLHLLASAGDAFSARLELIRDCRTTLDLQYYLIQDDYTGKEIINEILKAASRGVKIRILVDNLYIGDIAATLATLHAHRNIDVRSFNPSSKPRRHFIARMLSLFASFEHYSKRMHNKALIADGQMAIIGGRNLGDEYFGIHSDFAFSDLDILVRGDVIRQLHDNFETYWQSEHSHAFDTLELKPSHPVHVRQLRLTLYKYKQRLTQLKMGKPPLSYEEYNKLPLGNIAYIPAVAHYKADPPDKITENADTARCVGMDALYDLLKKAKDEFVAVTPYLIPQEEGMERFSGLVKRGLKVKILTNSLASTDVSITHAAYRRYRKRMLEAGILLYELKPLPGKRSRQNFFRRASRSSLHAKAYIVDRQFVVLGSFNLDPRSQKRNTESALVIRSPELAAELLAMFDEITQLENAYHLTLKKTWRNRQRIIWQSRRNRRMIYYRRDPKPGPLRRVFTFLFYYLVPESQL